MDQKEIVAVLKSEGLEVAEELAVNAIKGAFQLIKAMLPKVNPMMALVVGPMLDTLQPMLLDIVDKIDGKDNPDY